MSSVNEIPNGWTETTLGDVCKIKYGKDHKKLEDGDIPCYGSGGIMRYVDSILYDKPSVLIPRKGTLSNLFFIDEPFWTVDTLFYTQIDESIIKSNYLYYKLKTYNLADLNVGSAVPSLTTAVLNQFPFSIPKDIEEQKAIANILTAFDDKIENLQAQNKTLEQTAQTIFAAWFGKYQVGDELPDGWRVGKITELFEIRDGTHDSPKQKKTGYKLITSKHLGNNRIKLEDAYLISEEDYINVNKRSRVEQFDILVSMIGTIGLTYLEQNELINYAIKNVALFKTSQNKIFSIYSYLWLKSSFGKYFFETSKSGTTQEYISLKSFRGIELAIPNDKIINRFNDIVFNLFGKIKNNADQIQSLKKTRNTLLPKLMSGQLRVKMSEL
ncbi:restriction endonuclease subunit S [uncultured Polaribacter sp.]|uniref:restriction endonuclease subunit S n=1 Tax=uncultured Polaribacter sp. TaxID=174711 RepID=UPI002604F9E9|nr:restriction endonuclease subunit S [uncultured Polaribacter sp.]